MRFYGVAARRSEVFRTTIGRTRSTVVFVRFARTFYCSTCLSCPRTPSSTSFVDMLGWRFSKVFKWPNCNDILFYNAGFRPFDVSPRPTTPPAQEPDHIRSRLHSRGQCSFTATSRVRRRHLLTHLDRNAHFPSASPNPLDFMLFIKYTYTCWNLNIFQYLNFFNKVLSKRTNRLVGNIRCSKF